MTKVGIIGATGMAGSATFKAAQNAGLDVTAIVRNADKAKQNLGSDIQILETDAFNLTKSDLEQFDVVVDAFATAPEQAYLHTDLAAHLVAVLRETDSPRLIFILGAGSSFVGNGEQRHYAYDDIKADPNNAAWQSIPENQLYELNFLKDVKNVNWTGISPGQLFVPGELATKILYGKDDMLFDEQGRSQTTSETMAKAIIDEIITPAHKQERFIVTNG
ncbi:NAD(P)H-binding protein [Weissella paramesenteroides]|jgi:putative NADH-flavin reductase|uniref:NAD(P)H-binding protein n=1 Tax=Weissella paramesenteroides TaxID=1249 RepID=A0ABD4XJ95_WEIPA|nr:NAD(P)H-binding protein [Weissella paramesenteroides]KAA8446685.1 NAD-dependent epimerase/dehydratase family protein [Weissella paramesenteroides]KAA8454421.1 NAD-dependent epimerase/dehydratase family protein [Weissella paramesenteroides]KAA8455789.1 NAD-dependent epimerase/dehydratase family protein [Weissella paramesenteroides]KAA8457637.1 NAD-dependent epimerase/dehydratase family protein [Weissella paramesenteroides]KAA8461194.1 NAD-dependent epimerase/dehydratase family protein [Weiss